MINPVESALPRVLSLVQLLVSFVMFGIIVHLALAMTHGRKVPLSAPGFPLAILAIDWIGRRQLSFRLDMATIILWLFTTGSCVVNIRAMIPTA